MEIKDSVIKTYLKNVYFITGTPCGGKTTISRALAKKHGFMIYDVDEEFAKHKALSNRLDQPSMNREFTNADEFFYRPYEEYGQWLIENTREQLDFVILDLIRLSQNQIVICDLHLTLRQAAAITTSDHIVFLLRDPHNIIADYCGRPDHRDFTNYINSASDPEYAKQNCNRTLESINIDNYEAIKQSSYYWLERDQNSTVENTLSLVEQHFGFCPV